MTAREMIAALEKCAPDLEVKILPTSKTGELPIYAVAEGSGEVWLTVCRLPDRMLRDFLKSGRLIP